MAGETIRTEAVCLAIYPWSRTSHVVSWLTPTGRVATVVKGAVRAKSAFLGQYDLNYTCEILYYARAHGDAHALRECVPLRRRDALRDSWRTLALTDWYRRLAGDLTPSGREADAWFRILDGALDAIDADARARVGDRARLLGRLLAFEIAVLDEAGLAPDVTSAEGALNLRGERKIPVGPAVLACLADPMSEKNPKILLDAARAIGVFYTFHVDCAPEVRRTVLRMISQPEQKEETR